MLSSSRPKIGRKGTVVSAVLALSLAGAAGGTLVAPAGADPQPDAGFDLSEQLRKRVTPAGIDRHLDAFQQVADAHDGNRASGTPGYDASVDYVVRTLEDAGYDPQVQEFEFAFFEETGPSTLAQVAPDAVTYDNPDDYVTMEYSGSGDVTADVVPVDTDGSAQAPSEATNSGCETEDFAGFPDGAIALVQRGSCSFAQKAANAEAAGAAATVVFNYGVDGLEGPINGTLGQPGIGIPVLGASYATGAELYDADQARVATQTTSEKRTTSNVIAQTRSGDTDQVVMAGAHLDSVPEGAGINDNGSGSAALLETAVQLAKWDGKSSEGNGPRLDNAVRFAWWGAEESGLVGSTTYVDRLSQEEIDRIGLYLNYDMVGSPNYVRFVYDGDNSDGGGAQGPEGSAEIEQMFHDYFASQDLPAASSPFSGRSDYGPFIAEGVDIPAGGLFTGAEGVKTEKEAEIYGGTAGEAYDPCYHQACDDRDNVSASALDEMSDAVAHAVATYATRTSLFDGSATTKPGKGPKQGQAANHRARMHPVHEGARR